MIVMLLGNKSESVDREVTYEEGLQLTNKNGIQFFETSALNGEMIQESFQNLAVLVDKEKMIRENFEENTVSTIKDKTEK